MVMASSSIYSQIRPYSAATPVENQAKALQLRALMQTGEMNDLKMEEYARARREEEELRSLTQQAGGDVTKLRDLVYGAGHLERGLALDKTIGEQKKQKVDTDKASLEHKMKIWEAAGQIAGGVTDQASYDQARQWGIANGLPDLPPQYDPAVVKKMQMSALSAEKQLAQQIKEQEFGLRAANQTMTPDGSGGYKVNAPLVEAEKSMRKAGATNIDVNTGTPPLSKTALNKVDEGLLDTTSRLMRLNNVQSQFKPEYLTIGGKGNAAWSALKEKGGMSLDPKEKKSLEEFSKFKSTALTDLNAAIKEATGATVGVEEAGRLMAAMPNAGAGLFDGDSPTQFEAKVNDITRQLKLAEARAVYIKRNGGSIDMATLPLERMPTLMNERGSQLEQEVKAKFPSMNQKDIQSTVKRQLAQEFGLVN